MAYTAWSVVYGEQPTAAKWNQLGANDAGFKDGTNLDNNFLITRHLGSSANLQIPASNLVAMPKFSAHRTAAYTTVAGTATKMPINVVGYDTASGYDTAQARYTIPAGHGGHWHFSARYSIVITTAYSWIEIRKNGTLYKRGNLNTPNNEYVGHVVSCDMDVSAGDYIEIFYQTGQAKDIETGASTVYFQGHRIL
jgi:hypothetical protein